MIKFNKILAKEDYSRCCGTCLQFQSMRSRGSRIKNSSYTASLRFRYIRSHIKKEKIKGKKEGKKKSKVKKMGRERKSPILLLAIAYKHAVAFDQIPPTYSLPLPNSFFFLSPLPTFLRCVSR